MNGSTFRRLLVLAVAVVALVAVALIAFHAGQANQQGRVTMMPFGPMRGYRFGFYGPAAWGGLGFLGLLIVGFLLVWIVLSLVLGPGRGGRATVPPGTVPPSGGGIDRLRELSEMHDRGALTDEEFTAAKRKLLDL